MVANDVESLLRQAAAEAVAHTNAKPEATLFGIAAAELAALRAEVERLNVVVAAFIDGREALRARVAALEAQLAQACEDDRSDPEAFIGGCPIANRLQDRVAELERLLREFMEGVGVLPYAHSTEQLRNAIRAARPFISAGAAQHPTTKERCAFDGGLVNRCDEDRCVQSGECQIRKGRTGPRQGDV